MTIRRIANSLSRRLSLTAALLLTGLLITAPGCEVIGLPFAAMDREEGPQTFAPKYHDMEGRHVAVLVLADEYVRHRFPDAAVSVSAAVSRNLTQSVPGLTTVSPDQVAEYQKQNPFWSAVPPRDLITALAVERLIVIDIAEYRTQEPGNAHLWRGVIDANVAVHEAEATDPDDKTFEEHVRAEFPESTTVGLTRGDDQTIQLAVLRTFARRASGLFHEYQE